MKDSKAELWSPAAKQDLRGIYLYYARLASPDVAFNLLQEIERAVAHIADRRAEFRERDDIIPGMRGVSVRPYMVFYRIAHEGPQIVRVLHERQDNRRIVPRSDRT